MYSRLNQKAKARGGKKRSTKPKIFFSYSRYNLLALADIVMTFWVQGRFPINIQLISPRGACGLI